MPPKKKDAVTEEKPLLGRFGTSLKMGIVGLPNVGKSSLFNVLTSSTVASENYPFCTLDPSDARVKVPDERFEYLCEYHKPASKQPSWLNVVDIAGLVKGANEGQGLGNAFLSHIQAADGIFSVCRAFEDADVTHVEGDVDPIRDLEIIHGELRLKDLERMGKLLETLHKAVRAAAGKDKKAKADVATAEKVIAWLESGKDVRYGVWTAAEIECLNDWILLTSKPVVYLVNLTPKDYIRKKNKWLVKIHEWVKGRESRDVIIPFSAQFEHEIADMDDAARKAYLEEHKTTSALPKIIVQGFKALNLEYFFTAGADEVRAWTIRKNCKAPQAAGKIHKDFERGFIMADIYNYADFFEHESEAAVKAAGRYRQEGKNYIMKDGDIAHFKFNVTAPAKK